MHPTEKKELTMARCETCGNEYSKAFRVNLAGESHIFDCFECAILALAPECATVAVRSSDMESRPTEFFIVVLTA